MPKGPKGEKRPADVIAVTVMRIASGEGRRGAERRRQRQGGCQLRQTRR